MNPPQQLANSIAVLNRRAPYAGSVAQDSLEFVMAMSNFGQQLSLFFVDDGVYQLLSGQAPQHIVRKHFTKGLAALPFYDVDNIFVCQRSLEQRGIQVDALSIKAQLLASDKLAEFIAAHKQVVTF